ncbi:nucleotide sugar dehydrogenase [candidate division KSB1 bacterium]|nr:nucleotide sugar dehydrogenase [candidate division KSB1 bacterium]
MHELSTKLSQNSAQIGIIGLGYVGIPIAVEYAKKGFHVRGFDLDEKKVKAINHGENYIDDIDDADMRQIVDDKLFSATTTFEDLVRQDVIYICVPTPFKRNKEPDNSHIHAAAQAIAERLQKGQLIIIKSTTYPETTENEVLPILEKPGFKVGQDFYLAFSPERVDPGNKKFTTANTPIVVGGVTEDCTKIAAEAIGKIITHVHTVSNPRVAEMEKLLENIFRSVNIALVNELARLCDRMGGIDIWEVVEAAATKPFGFMPFYPGPGIGGHCILVDPYFLSSKAREYDFHTNFIELAAETNEDMPFYVSGMIRRSLSLLGVPFLDATVLVLGVAFKKDIDDTRNSPALKIMELLMQRGVTKLHYNDPYVPSIKVLDKKFKSVEISPEFLQQCDVVVIATNHSAYDYEMIAANAKSVVDTRNATNGIKKQGDKILKLGSGVRF